MTPSTFRKNAERIFRNANPGTVSVTWKFTNRVTWADGTKGIAGRFIAEAPGYRTREMGATLDSDGIWVR